jgi:hypothetical protein
MYTKKEEWAMLLTLLITFFSNNYLLRLYIENYTCFVFANIISLYMIGASIIMIMEYRKMNILKN